MKSLSYIFILASLLFQSCELPKESKKDIPGTFFDQYNSTTNSSNLPYRDSVYIPILSEFHLKKEDVVVPLTVTLSIQNNSLVDTIYIDGIDYYTKELVRRYLVNQTLALSPMQSIEYLVEEEDQGGALGANFVINWATNNKRVSPIFKSIMASVDPQQEVYFSMNGDSIGKK